MHEGKHGLLDGVDDIDDVFGSHEHEEDRPCTCERKLERCICGDEEHEGHGHEHK